MDAGESSEGVPVVVAKVVVLLSLLSSTALEYQPTKIPIV